MAETARSKAGWRWIRLVLAVCVGSGLAHIATSAMPLQVSALMDNAKRSAAGAGLFGSVEIGALALSMIAIAPHLKRASPKVAAVAGCATALVSNLLIYFSAGSFEFQLLAAAVAGAGFGLVFAATVAEAAASPDPDRLYGIGNSGEMLIIAGVMSSLPLLASRLGGLGIFAALACLALCCMPLMLGLKREGEPEAIRSSSVLTPGAPRLLLIWSTFSCGTAAMYAFAEQMGRNVRIEPAHIALILSAGTFTGLIGTGAAAVLGSRLERKRALIMSLIASAIACLLIAFATTGMVFSSGVFLYRVSSMFAYSYLQGTAAILDPSGSLGALAGGCERLSFALGVALGGVLVQRFSYGSTGVLGFVGCLSGLALGLPSVAKALEQKARI